MNSQPQLNKVYKYTGKNKDYFQSSYLTRGVSKSNVFLEDLNSTYRRILTVKLDRFLLNWGLVDEG